jgi:hypothetical protein
MNLPISLSDTIEDFQFELEYFADFCELVRFSHISLMKDFAIQQKYFDAAFYFLAIETRKINEMAEGIFEALTKEGIVF